MHSARPLQRLTGLALMLLAASGTAAGRTIIPEPLAVAERLFSQERLPASLDGRLGLAYRIARGESHPAEGLHPLLGASVDSTGLRVRLRFAERPTERRLWLTEELGCRLARLPDGAFAAVGPVIEADCAWASLERLGADPAVAYVEPTFDYAIHRPQSTPANTVARDVQAVALREKLHPLKGRGKGVVVADMDSGFDPFHPMFFRADGGAFPWIDTNGNKIFEPLIDAVDFNRNGVADTYEKLGVIKASITSRSTWPTTYNATGSFVPGVDWLYRDENGDGARNYGKAAPYGESKPTYGEQLFVADDVNKNGALDPAERVIALKTQKVRKAYVVNADKSVRVFTRGVDLSQLTQPAAGDERHGSMVMGTIAGGDPDYMKYTGIAPDAELLIGSTRASNLTTVLAWAMQEGAQIVLWEMATWYWEFLDGSSAHEVGCDSASDDGALQIGAAGNLGGSRKHRVAVHPGSQTQSVPLEIPANLAQYAYGNFNWRGSSTALSISTTFNGVTVALSGTSGSQYVGATALYWSQSSSTRGTQMVTFYFVAPQGQTLPAQTATFSVVNNTASPVTVHGYVADEQSSWGLGVNFPASTGATDQGTYGTPGTGDKTLSIGTMYNDFVPSGETAYELASHSGRGPRIDGLDTVDLVTPEDHITAFAWAGQAPFGALFVGGGTSNASPVAVGLFALLKEANPTATPTGLRDRMRQYALVETRMGTVPNDNWGHGKARVHRANYLGTDPTASQPPVARGTAAASGGSVWLDPTTSTDPEGQSLMARWDLDYDGVYDLGPVALAPQQATLPVASQTHVKLEVFDPHGRRSHALVPVTAGVSPDGGTGTPDGGEPGDGGSTGGGGGGGAGGGWGGGGGGGSGKQVLVRRVPDPLGEELKGCGCASAPVGALPLALLLLLRRRRSR